MSAAKPCFIDVFAGAGGLSLGLLQAGWCGLFAIEKSPMAFETLRYNLIDQPRKLRFSWPSWLPIEAISIETLLKQYKSQLQELKGVDLLAGGPPCQGFSTSGRRETSDRRNRLFRDYLKLVRILEPRLILFENVSGFATPFKKTKKGVGGIEVDEEFNAARELEQGLVKLKYTTFVRLALMAKDFGVPQLRPRYVLIAIRKDLFQEAGDLDPFVVLENLREQFLAHKGLPADREISLEDAISDLLKADQHVPCIEPGMGKYFRQGKYGKAASSYQTLMRKKLDGSSFLKGEVADSHRFANHKPEIKDRFKYIIASFRPGIQLTETELQALELNKHRIAPLAAKEPCHTLTSLPDDLIHYSEPRIPTVREYARIQSFPDWYEFKSKYTTGGDRRKEEVPRYTQVANAVPPLLAEVLGQVLQRFSGRLSY